MYIYIYTISFCIIIFAPAPANPVVEMPIDHGKIEGLSLAAKLSQCHDHFVRGDSE